MKTYSKKINLFLVLILAISMLFTACSTPDETDSDQNPKEGMRTVVDMDGAEVIISEEVNKVVNLWPSSNSVMLAMGAGEKLAGTMEFTKELHWSKFVYPDIVNVPVATDNAEELLSIDPDLVIVSDKDTAESLRTAGLPAMNLFFSDYESMKKAISILGDLLGSEYVSKAETWCKMVDGNTTEVSEAMASLKEEDKPKVYYIQGQSNNGLYATFGADSIFQEWTEIAGGIYIPAQLKLEQNQAQAEEILAANPDVVIIGGPAQHELYDELMNDTAWKEINAVKNNRVYTNPNGLFPWDRFGMESALQIKFAAAVINPELYKVNLVEEAQEFYKTFMDIELTNEEAQNMIDGLGPNGEGY